METHFIGGTVARSELSNKKSCIELIAATKCSTPAHYVSYKHDTVLHIDTHSSMVLAPNFEVIF